MEIDITFMTSDWQHQGNFRLGHLLNEQHGTNEWADTRAYIYEEDMLPGDAKFVTLPQGSGRNMHMMRANATERAAAAVNVCNAATSLRAASSPHILAASSAITTALGPTASCLQDRFLRVDTLTLPSLLSPVKHMNSNGVLPMYSLKEVSSAASLKNSQREGIYFVVLLSFSLLPSTRRTSAMFIPVPALRSSRILATMAMRSNRCICVNCNTSAIVTVGTGVCGKDVLCSSACACDLRRSIAIRHEV